MFNNSSHVSIQCSCFEPSYDIYPIFASNHISVKVSTSTLVLSHVSTSTHVSSHIFSSINVWNCISSHSLTLYQCINRCLKVCFDFDCFDCLGFLVNILRMFNISDTMFDLPCELSPFDVFCNKIGMSSSTYSFKLFPRPENIANTTVVSY